VEAGLHRGGCGGKLVRRTFFGSGCWSMAGQRWCGGARQGVEEVGNDDVLAGRAGRGDPLFDEAATTVGLCATVHGSASRCLPAWMKEENGGLDLGHPGPNLGFRGFVAEVPALRWSVATPRPGWRWLMDRGS
jgi:hypothetical protein